MDVMVRHVLPLSAEDYWQTLYSSRPFIEALYSDGLGGSDLHISEWTKSPDGGFRRALDFRPKMQAPAPVKRVLGDAFRCEERGHFDPKSATWRFQYLSSAMGKKIAIHGTQTTRPHPDGCEVTCRLEVTVSIFGVGRLVEKTIASQFETDMRAQAGFIRRWLASNPG
jgi:hypothetical protein